MHALKVHQAQLSVLLATIVSKALHSVANNVIAQKLVLLNLKNQCCATKVTTSVLLIMPVSFVLKATIVQLQVKNYSALPASTAHKAPHKKIHALMIMIAKQQLHYQHCVELEVI